MSPLAILLFAIFVDFVGMGLLLPLIPFLAKDFGASPFEITLLFSLHPAVMIFSAPLLGRLSDRFGRKGILVLSLLGTAVTFLLYGIAESYWMLFAARGVQGLMAGNMTVAQAFAADLTSDKDRAKAMGRIGAAISSGFVAGPILAAVLGTGDAGNTSQNIFAIAAITSVIAALLCLRLPNLAKRPRTQDKKADRAALKAHMTQRSIMALCAATLVVTVVFTQLMAILPLLFYATFDWGVRNTGLAIAMIGMIYAFQQGIVLPYLSRRFGEIRILRWAVLLCCFSLFALFFARTPWLFIPILAAFCFTSALCQPAVSALISRMTNPDMQGSVLGVANAMGSIARVIAAPVGGLVFETLGPSWPILVSGIFMSLSWLGFEWAFRAGHLGRSL